jgi:hypothetical protein
MQDMLNQKRHAAGGGACGSAGGPQATHPRICVRSRQGIGGSRDKADPPLGQGVHFVGMSGCDTRPRQKLGHLIPIQVRQTFGHNFFPPQSVARPKTVGRPPSSQQQSYARVKAAEKLLP